MGLLVASHIYLFYFFWGACPLLYSINCSIWTLYQSWVFIGTYFCSYRWCLVVSHVVILTSLLLTQVVFLSDEFYVYISDWLSSLWISFYRVCLCFLASARYTIPSKRNLLLLACLATAPVLIEPACTGSFSVSFFPLPPLYRPNLCCCAGGGDGGGSEPRGNIGRALISLSCNFSSL